MGSLRIATVAALGAGLLLVSGCAAPNGWAPRGHGTVTKLNQANFTVSKTNLKSEVSCSFIFGGRLPAIAGSPVQLPGIPLGDYELWKNGMTALKNEAGDSQLVNVTSDYSVTSYLGFFNVHTLTLTADAVDFQ